MVVSLLFTLCDEVASSFFVPWFFFPGHTGGGSDTRKRRGEEEVGG